MEDEYKNAEDCIGSLVLGRWRCGGDQVFGNHLSENELKPVFDKAMECGLNLWDTAAVYGEGSSERILGNFVKEVSREDVILSTKFTPDCRRFTGCRTGDDRWQQRAASCGCDRYLLDSQSDGCREMDTSSDSAGKERAD